MSPDRRVVTKTSLLDAPSLRHALRFFPQLALLSRGRPTSLKNVECPRFSPHYHVLNRRVGRLPLFEDQKMVSLFSPYSLASIAALHFPFDQAIQAAYE